MDQFDGHRRDASLEGSPEISSGASRPTDFRHPQTRTQTPSPRLIRLTEKELG
jgi:hypothetical protein